VDSTFRGLHIIAYSASFFSAFSRPLFEFVLVLSDFIPTETTKMNSLRPVQPAYKPSFLACFFSRNSIFLSQKISRNNISACFFSEANGEVLKQTLSPKASVWIKVECLTPGFLLMC
jgi:hypothetical protein